MATIHLSSLPLSQKPFLSSSAPPLSRKPLYLLKPFSSKTLILKNTSKAIPFATVSGDGGGGGVSSIEPDHEERKLREECGVVGIYGAPKASHLCYFALHAIQHRGQEGGGIVTADDKALHPITGLGLVSNIFNKSMLDKLPGEMGIGHVRYSTTGLNTLKNIQPFVAETQLGSVAVAHNGNLTNYAKLKKMLREKGFIFSTSSDTEVVLHLINMSEKEDFVLRIIDACEQIVGAYSMVFLMNDKLVAVRDPRGFRPLVMGRTSNGAVVFASETCAFDIINAKYEREVQPGEVVAVHKDFTQSFCLLPQRESSHCSFEPIYFSQPESVVFGRSVYDFRYHAGVTLAAESPVDCDIVISVPDSGDIAAYGYASKSGVEFHKGLRRRGNSGRTFIEPTQAIRDERVKLKLAPIKSVLEGKRVVVVDDSIVRGTTAAIIVRMIKEAGAKEVHMRIACPPVIGHCSYGVDIKSTDELISNSKTVEEIRQDIGCDSLAFLSIESLKKTLRDDSSGFCYACLTKEYPIPPHEE